ncbi:hypothetical protein KJ359_008908 [Pestalotiopsis sp. 9143b]|nr:hypothetical protein KJ359_008908 [Pestalotiopsis sp. 9143b]
MPLGWYFAQGLIPLRPSSGDDEEGPYVLSNDEDEDGHFDEDERMRNMMRAAGLGGFADDSGGDEEMDATTEH